MAVRDTKLDQGSGVKSHMEHLCYMVSQGFHVSDEQEYKVLVENPRHKCLRCGRVAANDDNLCSPGSL